jgi:ribonucleotide monophosphatase NagD (HAD superfamily)
MVTGVLLDIDGVLTVSWKLLPGAVETVAWLRHQQIDFQLVTNTSSKTRRHIAKALSDVGLMIAPSEILTAVSSSSRYLRR